MTNHSSIGSSPLQVTYPPQGEGHQATTPFLKDIKASYMMIVHSHHYLAKFISKLLKKFDLYSK